MLAIGSKKRNLVDYFNNFLNEKFLNDTDKNVKVRDLILKEMKQLKGFFNNLKDKKDFPVEKVWIGKNLIKKLNYLKTELNIYRFERRQDPKVDQKMAMAIGAKWQFEQLEQNYFYTLFLNI